MTGCILCDLLILALGLLMAACLIDWERGQ